MDNGPDTVSSDSDYGKCRPREALIETKKGISTFRWKINNEQYKFIEK
ncbi:MAG: hypothetical protein P0Y63_01695 [Klebsiella huaxiensis]|nr:MULTISPECIES: hypothetical protein [Klebsiella]MBA7932688.1 hypothetical protein [Klebsiella sp. RHBSTW-00215]WEJ92550.1 MAG: hypothetical protein P0Y63_01695 [Klebsiella huaxiensis]